MVHTAMWPVGAILPRETELSVQRDRNEKDESLDSFFPFPPNLKDKELDSFLNYYFETFLLGIVILL